MLISHFNSLKIEEFFYINVLYRGKKFNKILINFLKTLNYK